MSPVTSARDVNRPLAFTVRVELSCAFRFPGTEKKHRKFDQERLEEAGLGQVMD